MSTKPSHAVEALSRLLTNYVAKQPSTDADKADAAAIMLYYAQRLDDFFDDVHKIAEAYHPSDD